MRVTQRAENIIKEDWLETYQQQRNILWNELINLNTRLFLLEKIEGFPFNLFIPHYDNRIFWHFARNSFIETLVMGMWRVVFDTKSLSIRRFKNNIVENRRNEDALNYIRNRLREGNFEATCSRLEEKIKHARHNFLAHLNEDNPVSPNPQMLQNLALRRSDLNDMLASTKAF